MRVIRESSTPDDLRRFLNASVLRKLWPELVLPPRVHALWLDRFPELGLGVNACLQQPQPSIPTVLSRLP